MDDPKPLRATRCASLQILVANNKGERGIFGNTVLSFYGGLRATDKEVFCFEVILIKAV